MLSAEIVRRTSDGRVARPGLMTHDERDITAAAFQERLTEAVDPSGAVTLGGETRLRDLDTWDSITAVSTVAMIYAEYDVQVSGDDLINCETVDDLFALVRDKLAGSEP
ncbi:MAG: acyl carrier protein [Leptolyngbya sp. SIO3F4]|nr:acyl carrier protein [Leptolyngbya sp. SIO3F4]